MLNSGRTWDCSLLQSLQAQGGDLITSTSIILSSNHKRWSDFQVWAKLEHCNVVAPHGIEHRICKNGQKFPMRRMASARPAENGENTLFSVN